MKAALLTLALALGGGAAAGCVPCRTSSDCDPGLHCEFESGECLPGCTSNADCSPTAQCDRLGICRPGPRPAPEDAGQADADAPDAGPADAAADAGG